MSTDLFTLVLYAFVPNKYNYTDVTMVSTNSSRFELDAFRISHGRST